jgi:hypothetical protein
MTGIDGRIFIACLKENVLCDVLFLDCDAEIFKNRIIGNVHELLSYEDRLKSYFYYNLLRE